MGWVNLQALEEVDLSLILGEAIKDPPIGKAVGFLQTLNNQRCNERLRDQLALIHAIRDDWCNCRLPLELVLH